MKKLFILFFFVTMLGAASDSLTVTGIGTVLMGISFIFAVKRQLQEEGNE